MALQPQNVPIKLSAGIDTKTDPKQVVMGKLLTLENGVFTSVDRIKKRNGYKALTQLIEGLTTSIDQGMAMATYKNELVMFTGQEMYSYSDSTARWSDKGVAASILLTSKSITRNTFQQTVPDAAYHSSGVEVFTWQDSRGSARYSVIDSITGEAIVADRLLGANADRPKPFAIGNFIAILFHDFALNHLVLLPIPITSPSLPMAPISIALNMNVTHPNWDADCDGNRIYLAYNNSDGGGGITVNYINSFLNPATPRDITGESAPTSLGVSIDRTLSQFWVAYHNGTQVKYFIRDHPLTVTPVLGPTVVEANSNTISNITPLANNGTASLYYTQQAAASYNDFIKTAHLTNLGVVTGVSVFVRSVSIGAKPFIYGGRTYLTVSFASDLQATYFVLDTINTHAVAKYSSGIGGGRNANSMLPQVSQTTPGFFLVPSLQKDLLTTVSGTVYTQTGVQAIVLDFISSGTFVRAELGENLHVTGGILYMYDGISLVEHGFNIYPENVSANTSTSGGNVNDGQHQYVVVYEWMDNQGQTHPSAPSPAVTVINSGGNTSTNTLTIPTLRITDKQPPTRAAVSIGVYRTEADQTIFYKVSSVTSPLLNSTTVDTVTYVDTASDASIIGNQLLYTTGGVIENIAAPACSFITTYKNRAIVLSDEFPNQWWYSKQVIPGSPVEFSDLFVNNVDQAGGKLIAAARLDSTLVLLKETLLYYVTGTGPDSTGAQNDFSDAQPIACDGGCVDKKSVILTPSGLIFKSQKGLYLLDRAFNVSYIGARVEAYNSAQVTSAELISNTTQVRFCLDTGIALVYDYFVNEWSVFTNHNAVDSVIFQDLFTYLTPEGLALQETLGDYSDNGHFIKLRLVTSWLSLGGLQAFQRVYKLLLLGEYIAPHKLVVQVAYDFNPFFMAASEINAGTLLQVGNYGADTFYGESTPYGGEFPLYQFQYSLPRQKCETVQFSIEDIPTTLLDVESMSLSAIGLEVGIKKGLNKVPATRSFG